MRVLLVAMCQQGVVDGRRQSQCQIRWVSDSLKQRLNISIYSEYFTVKHFDPFLVRKSQTGVRFPSEPTQGCHGFRVKTTIKCIIDIFQYKSGVVF